MRRTAFGLALAAAANAAPAEPWRHEEAPVNGVTLHYAVAGQGMTTLFLHGFPEFWYAWRRQLLEFGRERQAVAVDMRGYNLSSKPEKVEEYALPVLVEDVRALLERLSPSRRAVLVGHDWGGVVAWTFAMAHPERLEKLVIINAPHPAIFARELRENPRQREASRYMDLFRSPAAEAALSAMDYAPLAAAVFGGARRPEAFTEGDRKRYREAWARPGALTGGLNYYRAANLGPNAAAPDTPIERGLPAAGMVPVPTLVLWGERDTALLAGNLDGLERFVPSLKIDRVPEAGHWIVHEEPERVNREIRDFLR